MLRHNMQNFLARPLFVDALSGEFKPPQDPQQRNHTLARLAFSAYNRGDIAASEPSHYYRLLHGKRLPQFFSRATHPSWAPEVTAVATATSTGGLLLRMASIRLEAGGTALEVIDQSTHFGSGLTIVSGEEPQDFYHLEDRQPTVQAAVTKAAQEFFDAIAK